MKATNSLPFVLLCVILQQGPEGETTAVAQFDLLPGFPIAGRAEEGSF